MIPSSKPRPMQLRARVRRSRRRTGSGHASWHEEPVGFTHTWPALRNFVAIAPLTAALTSASSNTMNGAFPPSSSEIFLELGLRALRHQQLADGGRAGEAQLAHDRVRRHLAADDRRVVGVAGHHVEYAGREPGDLGQRRDRQREGVRPPA